MDLDVDKISVDTYHAIATALAHSVRISPKNVDNYIESKVTLALNQKEKRVSPRVVINNFSIPTSETIIAQAVRRLARLQSPSFIARLTGLAVKLLKAEAESLTDDTVADGFDAIFMKVLGQIPRMYNNSLPAAALLARPIEPRPSLSLSRTLADSIGASGLSFLSGSAGTSRVIESDSSTADSCLG
ncbi:MAG: hypothetical protein K0R66_707 [Gammaproteobacteria bacterium]|jgi:hypothetical protein|nr:hypothetical protein [Gammaproteobacteria bacterium]